MQDINRGLLNVPIASLQDCLWDRQGPRLHLPLYPQSTEPFRILLWVVGPSHVSASCWATRCLPTSPSSSPAPGWHPGILPGRVLSRVILVVLIIKGHKSTLSVPSPRTSFVMGDSSRSKMLLTTKCLSSLGHKLLHRGKVAANLQL